MIDPTVPSRRQSRVARHSLRGAAIAALAVLAFTAVTSPALPQASGSPVPSVLSFQTMIGNSGPYVGPGGAIRGIPAGGAPWEIKAAIGHVSATGQVRVVVRGLTLLSGTNPVPDFEAAVSCQSIDSNGNANVVNVFTPDFPASTSGNSVISATVSLPSPCFAPIIFITSPAPQSWFATTGM